MNYVNRLKCLMVILIFLILCTYSYFYNKKRESLTDGVKSGHRKEIKHILLWDIEPTHRNWKFKQDPITPEHLEHFGCEETKCVLTNNRILFTETAHFDAIVFNMSARTKEYPSIRHQQQLYIAMATDSPYETINHHIKIPNLFNLTMSYRLDSDIVIPFGFIREIGTNKVVAPTTTEIPWKKPKSGFYDDKFLKKFQESTQDLIWFSSECDKISSGKTLFANRLDNFVSVHVYGECGKLGCNKNNGSCEKLTEKYLFRGSLESFYCKDFVTEETFEDFGNTNSLMIVFGGAKYEKFFPPKSFIDAKNFTSMEYLGAYLQKLKTHPIEYIKYFWWTHHYKVDVSNNADKLCNLCKKIHEPNIQHQVNVVPNFYRWFYKDACSSPSHLLY